MRRVPRTYRAAVWLADQHPALRRLPLTVGNPVAQTVGFSKRLSDDEMILAVRIAGGFQPARVEALLSQLAKPVLVAWADDDRAVEPRVSQALVTCAASARSVRFDTGGHNLQSSHAVELADALVGWVGEL